MTPVSASTPAASRCSLDSPLSSLSGIGPSRQRQLAVVGLRTLADLLEILPTGYRDFSLFLRPSSVVEAGEQAVQGRLGKVRVIRRRGRRGAMVLAELSDDRSTLALLWPAQPWQQRRLEGLREVTFYGKVEDTARGWRMLNPRLLDPSEVEQAGPRPTYADLPGLGRTLAGRARQAALELLASRGREDWLPARLRRQENLPELAAALFALHCPDPADDLLALQQQRTPAWRRLLWGELVEQQLFFCWRLQRRRRGVSGVADLSLPPLPARLQAGLPFELTSSQQRVSAEIVADLISPQPMRRLLTGDVGCGKTVVLALAIEQVLRRGQQAALMAPTELLAEQHYDSLRGFLPADYSIGLLSSSTADAAAVRQTLAAGTMDLVVGTHALAQPELRFARLGLVVIDEQHRFGVGQRRDLLCKGRGADLLITSATPIPRSLALAAFGDFDMSLIDEPPPGRLPTRTEVLPLSSRKSVYRRLRGRLDKGEQAFIVVPRIEPGAAGVVSLRQRVSTLGVLLGGLPFAELSGRTPAPQRRLVLEAFISGKIRVLVATTVLEVGVDVAAATVMIIEGAEHFGLAQLHQLRGRVGRGSQAALCIALHGRTSAAGQRRLRAFAETDDGFALAQADLRQRGPGELLGQRQTGNGGRAVAWALADPESLLSARKAGVGLCAELAHRRPTVLRRRLAARLLAERRSSRGV